MQTRSKTWEKYPELAHLNGSTRDLMERRRRHRAVRYICFWLQSQIEKGVEPSEAHFYAETRTRLPPGFIEFWPTQRATYLVTPGGVHVRAEDRRTVAELGGFAAFAKRWDIDPDLEVYLRHSSVWQEWNATLQRVVPVLGE